MSSSIPLFMRALAAVREAERRDTVAVDDAGYPFNRQHYQTLYRELADARAVPKGIWNMNVRHSGATEARRSMCLHGSNSEPLCLLWIICVVRQVKRMSALPLRVQPVTATLLVVYRQGL